MSTAINQLVTADELLLMPYDGYRYELVAGELKRMSPAGPKHGWIALNLGGIIRKFVKQHRLGRAYGADTGFTLQRNPDTVMAPDAAFVRQARVEDGENERGYFDGPPDLAVEVVSPNDSKREVSEKVSAWLSFGTEEVWVVSPTSRSVTVYRSISDPIVYAESDVLSGGHVLPGFEIAVSEIFAE